ALACACVWVPALIRPCSAGGPGGVGVGWFLRAMTRPGPTRPGPTRPGPVGSPVLAPVAVARSQTSSQQPGVGRTRQGPAPSGAGPCPLLFNVWRCPALPHPLGCSTIGAGSRNDRVRNGTGCDTSALTTKQTFEHTTPPQWNQCALPCPHPQTNKQGGARRRFRAVCC